MFTARLRLAALLSGLAVFGLMATAQGAVVTSTGPKTLTVTDAVGDARGGQAGMDIGKVIFTTTGKTVIKKVKGKSIKSYTPDTLVVKLELAAPPTSLPPVVYEVDSANSACGFIYLYWDPEELGSGGLVECGSEEDATGSTATVLEVVPVLTGSTITWSMPFNTLPKEIRVGTTITDVHSFVALAEPITGLSTALFTAVADIDDADSGAVYKIG